MRKNVQELIQLSTYFYTQLIPVALEGLFVYGFEEHAVDPTLLLKKKGLRNFVYGDSYGQK